MKKSRTITMILVMGISMSFLTVNLGFAGGNPPNPGAEKTSGPVVQGMLEFTPSVEEDPDSPVQFSFYGTCKGQDVTVENQLYDGSSILSDVDELTIMDQRWDVDILPNKCIPKGDGLELIISKVKNYEDLGDMKVADVMTFFIGPK